MEPDKCRYVGGVVARSVCSIESGRIREGELTALPGNPGGESLEIEYRIV